MFHCSVIKDHFSHCRLFQTALLLYHVVFCSSRSFFNFFWSCFYFSLAATLVVYHIYRTVVKNFFCNFSAFTERRRRDLNPRAATNDLLPVQGSPFNLLGTSAGWFSYLMKLITVLKRREWDSNPRALSDKRFSRPPRYDHFDTSPHLSLIHIWRCRR